LKCGISFWGYLAHSCDQIEVETPDGLRGERAFFVSELLRRGHTVAQLQKRLEHVPFSAAGSEVSCEPTEFPDIDVLFVEWRWKRLGKSTEDWDRQCALLDHYTKVGVPIIVQDTDLMITVDDELRWPRMIICDPCMRTAHLTRARIHMPFCNVFLGRAQPQEEPSQYVYVGNNYDRQVQFERYYAGPSEQLRALGVQTTVHGNWLTKSPERMHPRAIVQQYPHVAFAPRVPYRDVRSTLGRSLAVCHISKNEYSIRGNVTVRYFEAIAAGVPALIPAESAPMLSIGEAAGMVVASSQDVMRKLKELVSSSPGHRAEIVARQEHALRELTDFSPQRKVELVEAAAWRCIDP
jgi:hypothetical protein